MESYLRQGNQRYEKSYSENEEEGYEEASKIEDMICVDTSCIIEFLKGHSNAVGAMERYDSTLVTTEVNRFEVLFGIHRKRNVRDSEIENAEEFFERVETLPFDEGCGDRAARLSAYLERRGAVIEQNDVMTAAVMEKHGCSSILTNNAKHFARIPGVEVIAC